MEFLQSLLRRHFAGKSVVTSGDVMEHRLFSQATIFVRLVNKVPQSEEKRPRKRMSGDY